MKDLIERQAAIDAVLSVIPYDEYWKEEVEKAINTLPSAQPERKTGKWELLPLSIIPPVYKCSACGRHAMWITTGCLVNRHYESYLSDFCPSCGADMREKHERFN